MTGEDIIRNKVAESGLITLDLEDFLPQEEATGLDIAGFLWEGLIIKEKDFREKTAAYPWEQLTDKHVAVYCSTDAIIPQWAWMLITQYLSGTAKSLLFGAPEQLWNILLADNLRQKINPEEFRDTRVIIKGCSSEKVTPQAYMQIVSLLKPVARSIMYGEACSTVPIYKKPKA